jgi:hypothetical protein
MNMDKSYENDLADVCESFLRYVNELFNKGQICQEEFKMITEEKIKFLEFIKEKR